MKFGILVNEGPYQHQASDSAYLFAKAAIDEGHEIFRVFFYHDGVNNGTRLATPPQDDRHIPNRWSELAKEHKIDLVLCVAAAQRRGMVDPDEMKRNNKDANNIAEFAIGTNPKARLVGNLAEDKKLEGSVHIAIGDNHVLGGNITSNIHLDGMVLNPNVELDGKCIINNGKLQLE